MYRHTVPHPVTDMPFAHNYDVFPKQHTLLGDGDDDGQHFAKNVRVNETRGCLPVPT